MMRKFSRRDQSLAIGLFSILATAGMVPEGPFRIVLIVIAAVVGLILAIPHLND
jgi:hypothetical protein